MAGLFDEMMAYIQANTPRSTRPVAKPSTVINQGLLNPNKFNAPAANRLKDSAFGLLGVVPGVGDVASAAESADLFNRGEKFAGSVAALGALPFVPAVAGMLKQGSNAADALGDAAKLAPQPTKYELAHEVAQKNAVDMLGLPPNNTAMDRARAMGFDTPAYHGTASDVQAFDIGKAGTQMTKDWGDAAYLTPRQSNAEYYAIEAGAKNAKEEAFKKYDAIERANGSNSDATFEALQAFRAAARDAEQTPAGANVMPLLLDTSKAERHLVDSGMTDPYLYNTLRMGQNGKDVATILDNPQSVSEYAVFNPSRIRSKFAAFDPARRNESDLLAGLAPYIGIGGLLSLGLMTPEQAQANQ